MTNRQLKKIRLQKLIRKRRNIKREQRKSFQRILKRSQKYIRYLSEFIKTEDPKTLWNKAELNSLASRFEKIKDPRKLRGIRHNFVNVVIMVLYAALVGKTDYNEIAVYLKNHEDDFTILLGLEHGVPSAATISRIMAKLDYEEFHTIFNTWTLQQLGLLEKDYGHFRLHLQADGKALRALTKKARGERHPPYMINVYLYHPGLKIGLCLATAAIDHKKSERTLLAPVLETFVLPGSIVTMDAAGIYHPVIEAILKRGADVLVCVKSNQKKLLNSVKKVLENARLDYEEETVTIRRMIEEYGFEQEHSNILMTYQDPPGISHGRYEERTYIVSHCQKGFDYRNWSDIQTVGYVKRVRQIVSVDNKEIIYKKEAETMHHYYVSTLEMDAESFADTVRKHWMIESRLHYILDNDAFKEDKARMRIGQAKENMCVVRRIAYNLLELLSLEDEKFKKLSFKNKTQTIENLKYGLEQIIFHTTPCVKSMT